MKVQLLTLALAGCVAPHSDAKSAADAEAAAQPPAWAVPAPQVYTTALAQSWDHYGAPGPAPRVWFHDPDPTGACAEDLGWADWDGTCVMGWAATPSNTVTIDTAPYWACRSIAHELCHIRSWYLTGDLDADHEHEPCFAVGQHPELGTAQPEDGDLVNAEVSRLSELGLCPGAAP